MSQWKDGVALRGKTWWIRAQYQGDRVSGFGSVKKFAFLLDAHQPIPTTRTDALALKRRVEVWLTKGKPMPLPKEASAEKPVVLYGYDLINRYLATKRRSDVYKERAAQQAFGALPLSAWEKQDTFRDYVTRMVAAGYEIATPNRILGEMIRPAVNWGINQEPPLLKYNAFGRYRFKIDVKAENRRTQRCDPDLEARLLEVCYGALSSEGVKLTRADVETIRTTLAHEVPGTRSGRAVALARQYAVSQDTISKIKQGRSWNATPDLLIGRTLADYIIFGIDFGARAGELLGLKNKDVDWHASIVTLRITKRGQPRLVPFNPNGRVAEVLRRRRFAGPDAYVIDTRKVFKAWVQAVCCVFDIPVTYKKRGGYFSDETIEAYKAINQRPHDFRHEAATWWGLCGMSDASAKFLQGHSSQADMHGRYKHEELRLAKQELAAKVWPREGERAQRAQAHAAGE